MKNKKIIVFTSILCILPVILSLKLYNRLPGEIAVHWNSLGEADRSVPKAFAAFGLPIFFLLINLYSKIRLFNDPKGENHSTVLRLISIWIIPFASLILMPVTLFMSLGADIPIVTITTLVAGILFIVLGNYLPKSHQNYVMGIKLPWTLDNADNWNRTNRLAGYLMIVGGMLILASGFFSGMSAGLGISLTVVIVILIVTIPFGYSYMLYRKSQS